MITRYVSEHKVNNRNILPFIRHHDFPVTEQRLGYAIFGLYIAQIVIGVFIHAVRVPCLFIAHRPPQNYLHAILGLVILAIGGYQVRLFQARCSAATTEGTERLSNQIHDGIYTEWPLMTANIPPVKDSAKHAWLALLIVS